jgi:hypothetical protein
MEKPTNIMLEGETSNNTNNETKDDLYFVDPENVRILPDIDVVNQDDNEYKNK